MDRQTLLNKPGLILRIVLIIVVVLIVSGAGLTAAALLDSRVKVAKGPGVIYSGSFSSAFFAIEYAGLLKRLLVPFGFSSPSYEVKKLSGPEVKIIKARRGVYVKSSLAAGTVVLEIRLEDRTFIREVEVKPTMADSDGDGLPDAAEINSEQDRSAFIDWFVSIAQSQFYRTSHTWYDVHRDCAGLVTFAYKEALKKHDITWRKGFGYLVDSEIPDVQQYNYPHIPLLFDAVFRTAEGPFEENDLNGEIFAPSCNVSNLINFNMHFISRDTQQMRPGDVLFYRVDSNPLMPFHSMIYTGEYLVYHTGPIPGGGNDSDGANNGEDGPGEVRMLKPEHLFGHPDEKWHPARDNPAFLGVYRFNIITG